MKKAMKILIPVLIAFLAVNAVWFGWQHVKYGKLSRGMEKNMFGLFAVPRYFFTDEEGYDYMVKYPDYMSFTGNLSVGMPSTEEDTVFTDALILWPKFGGGYTFGLLLYGENGVESQIYVDRDGNPLSEEHRDIVSRHWENVEKLLQKADEKWDLPD